MLGHVEHVAAEGSIGETGVDEQVAALLRHSGGRMGVIKAAIRVGMSCTARIAGTEGSIGLPAFMHCPSSLTVSSRAGSEEIDGSFEGNGLRFQLAAVQQYLEEGLTESPVMPLDETIALISTLDEIRTQIRLGLPGGISDPSRRFSPAGGTGLLRRPGQPTHPHRSPNLPGRLSWDPHIED